MTQPLTEVSPANLREALEYHDAVRVGRRPLRQRKQLWIWLF